MLRGKESLHIEELILLEAKKNPKTEIELKHILTDGFIFNGIKYVRFGKSSSQGKDGITAFIQESMFDILYMISQMDIEVDECVISKYESQRCLIFSSCTIIKDYFPNIVIIDEYEKTLKNQWIRYVVEKEKDFLDKDTNTSKKYKSREIEEDYHDIKLSPFDGCGCHEKEFMEKMSTTLGLDYNAIGGQIRLPFMKGYSVYVPFREILKEWGYEYITDIYGNEHKIDEVDCIWNTSMFKGHKLFKEKYGESAWDKYIETINKYKFKLGISKYSHHMKDINLKARMNFQYLQCLDLWNPKYIETFNTKPPENYDILAKENEGKMIAIAKYTTSLFEKIIKGEKFYTYKFMGVTDTEDYESNSKYIQAALINDVMLKDVAVKQFIHRKLKKMINDSKFGKIFADGFYHTIIGDMIGYLQFAVGLEPIGCLKEKEFYANTIKKGKVLSFRSPLVCPSEVNSVNIVSNDITDKWLSHFKDQDVVMLNMYDLSMPQQGGADADGDAVFLCSHPIIVESKINKPIIIDIEDKSTTKSKKYTKENIVEYEMNSRDNRIGEITNVATSIENKYTTNPDIQKLYSDYASLLRIFQGKEIDFLKTGLRWQMNKSLRKNLKQLPVFLLYNYPKKLKTYENLRQKNKHVEDSKDKVKLNAYRSPSPMNELCDYINAWEKRNLIWDNTTVDTKCLILNNNLDLNDKKIIKNVRHMINEYSEKMKKLSEKSDEERTILSKDIIDLYKDKIKNIEGLSKDEVAANYVIKVSYSNSSISKSLAWSAYGDYIIKNLSDNSNPKKNISIVEVAYKTNNTYEYLGKYYEFKGCDDNL